MDTIPFRLMIDDGVKADRDGVKKPTFKKSGSQRFWALEVGSQGHEVTGTRGNWG